MSDSGRLKKGLVENMEYLVSEGSILLKDEKKNEEIRIDVIRDDLFRVRHAKGEVKDIPSELVEDQAIAVTLKADLLEDDDVLFLQGGKLTARICTGTGRIRWLMTETGNLLLEEDGRSLLEEPVYEYNTGDEKPEIVRVHTIDNGDRVTVKNLKKVKTGTACRAKLHFAFREKEHIYGLGQGEEGIFDLRHEGRYLYHHNMRIPMPMFYSSCGYGIFVNCGGLMVFEDSAQGSYLFMDTVEQLDYFVIAGPTSDEVIDGFRFLTGKACILPKWAYGYVQSKEQYYTAKELTSVVERYRELEVPLDVVVQDWNSWVKDYWGEKILDEERYGDMKEQSDRIHELNAHTMVSIWPNINSCCENFQELFDGNHILMDMVTYNALSEEARRVYWEQADRGLFQKGFDSWWCDSTEPFSNFDWDGPVKKEPWERFTIVGDAHKKFLGPLKANMFGMMHAKGMYENQRKSYPDKRMLNLTRSCYPAGQKYGAMIWSGDICGTWKSMKNQIAEGLNMALSGYPFWTLDIGGFFVVNENWQARGCRRNEEPEHMWFWEGEFEEGLADYGFRELYVRWMQMGTFLPMFRSHGTDVPREIWNFGEPGTPFYDAIEKTIRLRYLLMPYIYSLAGAVHLENATMMRALFFDYGEDERTYEISDEFLFGRNLLICPVTEPQFYAPGNKKLEGKKACRRVYLPKGADWISFWTGEYYMGGQDILCDTPLDEMPIFVKAGSILPMKEGMQYTSDKADEPVILRLYTGQSGSFVLYEDEGESYRYEDGAFRTIPISWEDQGDGKGVLVIGEAKGCYPGCPKQREFILRMDDSEDTRLAYSGQELTVTIS